MLLIILSVASDHDPVDEIERPEAIFDIGQAIKEDAERQAVPG